MRHSGTLLAAALAALAVAPAVGVAQTARAEVRIRVPPIAQLDVQEPVPLDTGEEPGRAVEVRVRANHDWTLVVTSPAGRPVDVRIPGSPDGEHRLLGPGSELALTTGGRGESVLRIEYRWDEPATDPPTLLWRLEPR